MGNEKQNGLVGIRVIATLGIAVFHFELSYPFIEGKQIFGTSYLFVEMFFIMSGFLFAKGMISGRHANEKFSEVVEGRIIRLYPAYLFALLILPVVYCLAWYGGDYYQWLIDGNLKSFAVEVVMLQSIGLSSFKYINGPAWYVSALLLSTIVAFFFIKYVKKGHLFLFLSLVIYAVIWIFESPSMSSSAFIFSFVPVPLLRGIAGVFLGVSCYYYCLAKSSNLQKIRPIVRGMIELACLIVIMRLVLFKPSDWYNCLILIPFCILTVLLYSSNDSFISKVLSDRHWNFFSEISYSFYISQSFCSNVFTCLAPNVQQPFVFIWYMILNTCLAIFIHYFIEVPAVKLYYGKKKSANVAGNS